MSSFLPGRLAGSLVAAVLALSLSACGSSSGGSDLPAGDPAQTVDGKSTDVTLESNLDGVAIAITVHEPAKLAAVSYTHLPSPRD